MKKYYILAVLLLGFLSTSYILWTHNTQAAAIAYFENTLKNSSVTEDITIQSKVFNIIGGVINSRGNHISQRENFRILRLAYLKSMARRTPLLTLAGTDIRQFKIAVQRLQKTKDDLAHIQKRGVDIFFVQHALQPIGFLQALASAEEKRRTFLKTGRAEDGYAYQQALARVPKRYFLDSVAYEIGYKYLIPKRSVQYVTEHSSISRESTLRTIRALRKRMFHIQKEITRRNKCLTYIKYCNSKDIALPTIALTTTTSLSKKILKKFRMTRKYYDSLQSSNKELAHLFGKKIDHYILLKKSRCLNTSVLPIFSIRTDILEKGILEMGDVRFVPTQKYLNTRFYSGLFENGIQYSPSSPVAYYTCGYISQDIGTTLSIWNAAKSIESSSVLRTLVKNTPLDSLTILKEKISNEIITEASVRRYLYILIHEIPADKMSTKERNSIINLVLQINNRSSGMEFLVNSIVSAERINMKTTKTSNPVNITAKDLFFVRSGFIPLSILRDGSEKNSLLLFDAFSIEDRKTPYVYLSDIVPREITMNTLIEQSILYFSLHKYSQEK